MREDEIGSNIGSLGVKAHSIAVQTAMFERSFDFYTRILGLRVVRGPARFKTRTLAWLDAKGLLVELYSLKAGKDAVGYCEEAVGIAQVAFEVEDLDLAMKILDENGVKIVNGPLVPPSGDPLQPRILFIDDPDGTPVQLREPRARWARPQ